MTAPVHSRHVPTNVLDEVFSRIQRASLPAPPPRPREVSPVEEEWTQEEKQTVAEFTRRQMDVLRQQQTTLEQQRAEIHRRQHELNEACLLRQQELNRQIKELTTRRLVLEGRETDVGEQEQQVVVELHRLTRARQDLQQLHSEAVEQEQFLADLKNEAIRLLDSERSSRQELAELEALLRKRWAQAEKARVEIARERAELERIAAEQQQRQAALDRRERELNLAGVEKRIVRLHQQAEAEQRRVEELQAREEALKRRLANLEAILSRREREGAERERRRAVQREHFVHPEEEEQECTVEL